MKSIISTSLPGLFLLALVIGACEKKETSTQHTSQAMVQPSQKVYTCPMHPHVISDKEGTCPECGMQLKKMQSTAIDTLALLIQPTNRFIVSKLRAIVPSSGKDNEGIAVEGYLTYDPSRMHIISSRISGRIEKLWVKDDFQKVRKGEKLADIYSPQLLTAQNELLYIFKSKDPKDQAIEEVLQTKLLHLGMSASSIEEMLKSGKPNASVPVFATESGHVHFQKEAADISTHSFGPPAEAPAMENENKTAAALQVLREGEYVKAGEALFTIANQTNVWALFKILPRDISFIQKQEKVLVTINQKVVEGKVDFIEKTFEDFYTFRVYLKDSDHTDLTIGTLVKGYISGKKNRDGIWVPATAVVQLGHSKAVVFVKQEVGYVARAIEIETIANEWIEIKEGISLTDSIAPIASYLVDSESFIQPE